ncbi:hypothetical protein M23134_08393 [Microscilla marina ATCC 23134]|uniref:Uncharacterized protein n=1 Tax=Microscilla marina ATCC 23134 TaxID=313606 RepID=A1ZR30_MICM2|nr:hypothetical protein M23134_08393 [Microscilla marina ATCC 23134]
MYVYPCLLVQKRLPALYLKSTIDSTHQQIAKVVGIQHDTLVRSLL